MKHFFITGTGTDVGKTMASAAITLARLGQYWKPIQSGTSDRLTVQQLTGLGDSHFLPSVYEFQASLSPDQAAALENKMIDLQTCHMPTNVSSLVVEGAGGIFVPLNENKFMLDLMKQCYLPIIVVAHGKLGTINHTLLTLEVLRYHQLPIHGVVFSGELNPNNQLAIEKMGNVNTLFHIPHFSELTPSHFQQWVRENNHLIMESLS